MILHQFQKWARTAPASGRADGISALARAYLHSNLGDARRDALRVLTEFLDDPSPLVRRALAEAVAGAGHAPHHLILALADDQADIASIVVARSPVLTDAELIDCATAAGAAVQTAIASRPSLTASIATVLAEVAVPSALIALAKNRGADLHDLSIRRMVERHGDEAELREALLTRPDLPASVRVELVAATTRALAAFVTGRNWMSDDRMKRVATEARDKAAITIAGSRAETQRELVAYLRQSGQLTVGLAFRAVLSGRLELFKATVSELSGMPLSRVDGLTRHCESTGFAALFRKAGLPTELLPAFRAALQAAQVADWQAGPSLSRSAIERVLTACEAINGGALDKLIVMLRRFEAEAARDEARHLAHPSKLREAVEQTEPLLLRDFDEGEDHTPVRVAATSQISPLQIQPRHVPMRPMPRREPATYTIDLQAIELELFAA